MKRHSEALDMLILEAHVVYADMKAMQRLLEACPSCSVKHADTVAGLGEISGTMVEVMARLRALKVKEV